MVADRTSVLIVQAATEGLVDFSQADYHDPKWNQRLGLILDGLQRKNQRELHTLLFQQALAIAATRRLSPEKAEELADRISDLYYDIRNTYYPQEKGLKVQHEKQLVRDDIRNWEGRFGDMNDPETKEKIDRFAEAMERLRQETAAKMRSQAASQLGYVGTELGIKPKPRSKPGKGRR